MTRFPPSTPPAPRTATAGVCPPSAAPQPSARQSSTRPPAALPLRWVMPFDGLRVLSLESRRGPEMATLIRKQGGDPVIAPSMREVPLEQNDEAFAFAERLFAGDYDALLLLTGVGTRLLWNILLTRYPADTLKSAFSRVTLIARGPKPSAAARELGLTAVVVGEPNTWREVLAVLRDRPERRIAVQEYGKTNTELNEGLLALGRRIFPVRVYAWELPEDLGPLRDAARRLAAGQIDVALFTTSMQLVNLLRVAADDGLEPAVRAALARCFVASIGPTTTETLEEHGFRPDFEPSHPKMGLLVNESAGVAAQVLANRR